MNNMNNIINRFRNIKNKIGHIDFDGILLDDLFMHHNFIGHRFWQDDNMRLQLHVGKFWNNTKQDNPIYDDQNFFYLVTDFERSYWRVISCNGDTTLTKTKEQQLFKKIIENYIKGANNE